MKDETKKKIDLKFHRNSLFKFQVERCIELNCDERENYESEQHIIIFF